MHTLYINERQRIFTIATLNELHSKRIEIFTPTPVMAVRLEDSPQTRPRKLEIFTSTPVTASSRRLPRMLQSAINDLYRQMRNTHEPMQLKIDHCKALRQLAEVVPLKVPEKEREFQISHRWYSVLDFGEVHDSHPDWTYVMDSVVRFKFLWCRSLLPTNYIHLGNLKTLDSSARTPLFIESITRSGI